MKVYFSIGLLIGLLMLLASCTGVRGGASVGVYHHHHFGPWWGARDYYRDRVIVLPPEREIEGEVDPDFGVPAPSAPEPELMPEPDIDIPDMGMPEFEAEPF